MANCLAVRMHASKVDPAVYDYVSPVPLFGSGAEAAAHGMADIEDPGPAARAKARQLLRVITRRQRRGKR